jgi:hypothetical protein
VRGQNNGAGAGVEGQSVTGAGGAFSGPTAASFNATTTGIQITNGNFVGSLSVLNSGDPIGFNKTVVHVNSNGGGTPATAVPSSGVEGQIMFISTDDPQGVTIGTFTVMGTGVLIFASGAWRGPL